MSNLLHKLQGLQKATGILTAPTVAKPTAPKANVPSAPKVLDYSKINPSRLYNQAPKVQTAMTTGFKAQGTSTPTSALQMSEGPGVGHLKALHKCVAKLNKAVRPPLWQQPKMSTAQIAMYNQAKAGLSPTNQTIPLEQLNEIAHPNHPVFPFLTREDHRNAYQHWYKLSQNSSDPVVRDQAKANAAAHNKQVYAKV